MTSVHILTMHAYNTSIYHTTTLNKATFEECNTYFVSNIKTCRVAGKGNGTVLFVVYLVVYGKDQGTFEM